MPATATTDPYAAFQQPTAGDPYAAFQSAATPKNTAQQEGSFEHFWNVASSYLNPIPAIKDWLNKGDEVGKAADALKTLDDLHKRAADLPENKGKPPNKWVMPSLPSDQQAIVDKGMSANIGMGPDIGAVTNHPYVAPAYNASQAAKTGDYVGAAAHIVGGYGLTYGIQKAPELIDAANKMVDTASEVLGKPKVIRAGAGGVGAAVGAGIGHATGIPYAGWAGAAIGREIGHAVADSLAEEPSVAQEIKPGFEEAAKALGAKDFSSLPQGVQDAIRNSTIKPAKTPPPAGPSSEPIYTPETSAPGKTVDQLIQEELAAKRAANPAPPPIPPEFDEAARALGGKDFTSLPEGVQNAIRRATIKPAITSTPPPAEPSTPRATQPVEPAAPGKTVRQMVDEDLAQRRAANVPPAAPPAAEVAPAPVETPTEAPAPVAAPVPATSEPQAAAPEQPATPPETPASATPRYQIPDNKFGDKLDATDMPVLPGHTKLSSSTAHSAGFDPETGDPQIHFLPWKKAPQGTLYRYPDMPPQLLRDAIDHAPSFGKFVREQVRPNYTGIRMQLPEPGAPLLSGVDYGAVEQPVAPPATPEPATPQSESGQTAEPEAAAEPAVSTTPPGTIAQMPTDQIRVDAPRFQFKQNVGQGGAGEELRVVKKFDPEKSGILSVWKDPADNETYVVNGHNRLALAQRTGEPSVTVRYIDAKDAAEARTKGALINIAEGRGDAIDAAKVFRDSGIGPEELEAEGLSPTGSIAKNGMALANLDPYLFNKVVSGELPVERASVIGQGVKEAADQRALFDLLSEREKAGKRLTNDQVGEMIRLTNEAPKLEETQDSLFGSQEMTRSLIPEKAEVSDYIRRQLAQEGKLFQAVATEGAADKLASTGNVIKAGENAKVAVTAAQAKALYDKLSTTAGSVNDALDQAAASIAKGGSSSAAKTIAYQKIKSDLFKQAKSLAGEGEAPTERPQGDGPSGPHQAGGNHPYQVGDTVRVKGVDHPVVIKSIKPNGEIEW